MRILCFRSAAAAGTLTVGGAFTVLPPADAATPGCLHAKTAIMARANVTVITEIQNAIDYPAWLYIGESNSWFGPIDAHSTKASDTRVPWGGDAAEMGKSIRV